VPVRAPPAISKQVRERLKSRSDEKKGDDRLCFCLRSQVRFRFSITVVLSSLLRIHDAPPARTISSGRLRVVAGPLSKPSHVRDPQPRRRQGQGACGMSGRAATRLYFASEELTLDSTALKVLLNSPFSHAPTLRSNERTSSIVRVNLNKKSVIGRGAQHVPSHDACLLQVGPQGMIHSAFLMRLYKKTIYRGFPKWGS
jgi:hypothetical protein